MGGFGSSFQGSKKRTVESCYALDTGDLLRLGLLEPGAERSGLLEWRRGGADKPESAVGYSVATGPAGGSLRLTYKCRSPAQPFDYRVPLVATACHLGGARWWFMCPLTAGGVKCVRRVRKVYLCGNYFGCRHCHRLAYRSTHESDSRVYAALRAGMHRDGFGHTEGMSVAQLGFALKVLTAAEKRFNRFVGSGKARYRRPAKSPGSATQPTAGPLGLLRP